MIATYFMVQIKAVYRNFGLKNEYRNWIADVKDS